MSSSTRHRINLLVTATALPLLLLALLELGLKGLGYGSESDFFVRIQGQDAFTTNPNFARQFFPPALARLPSPLRVEAAKPADITRIVVLGGSAAMGEPDPSYSFSRFLDVMLRKTYPERAFEVINASMATINSHVVRIIAGELSKIQPDYVLIYMGNNEVVGPFGAGTVFGTYSPNLTLLRMGIYVRSLRIGQLLENTLRWATGKTQFVSEGQGMAAFRDQYVQASDPRMPHIYDHFRRNLADIVALSESSGARVVVSTVGANLVDHAPFGSLFGQEGADPISWGRRFAEGVERETSGQSAEATAAFASANRIDSTHAELHFRLARLYQRSDRTDLASAHYQKARNFDVLRFRVDSSINGVLRQFPESATVIRADAEQWLAEADTTAVGLPGREHFHEHVHLTAEGNYVLARGFWDVLRPWLSDGTADVSGSPKIPSQSECESLLALTPFDRYRLHESVVGLTQRAPFTGQFDHQERIRERFRRSSVLRSKGTSYAGIEASLEIYEQAIAARPSDVTLQQNYARLLQDSDALVEAASIWKQLLITIPDTPTWTLAMATALSDQGAHNAALQYYEALKDLMPGLVLPHIQIGYELVSMGQIGEAIHVLYEALDINPGSTVARLNLASLLADVGQHASGTALLDAAIVLAESAGDAHTKAQLLVGRSDLRLRQNQNQDAVADLESAVEYFELAGAVKGQAMTQIALAKALRVSGNDVAAEQTLRDGRAFADAFALDEIAGQAGTELAVLAMSTGRDGVAQAELEAALKSFRSLSDRHPALDPLERLLGEVAGARSADATGQP